MKKGTRGRRTQDWNRVARPTAAEPARPRNSDIPEDGSRGSVKIDRLGGFFARLSVGDEGPRHIPINPQRTIALRGGKDSRLS
jgi:hypothetical protein